MTQAKFLTEEQYNFICEKYGKLFNTIKQNISGDISIDFDDIKSEMLIVAGKVIHSFFKKYPGQSFDEFKETKHFDKFIKTAFWNRKNTIGSRINSINSSVVRTEDNTVVDSLHEKSAGNGYTVSKHRDSLRKLLDSEHKELVSFILKNPNVVEDSGKINISELSRLSNRTIYHITKELNELRTKYVSEF